MPLDPAVGAKILSHKFGRRKLQSKSAWYRYNKLVKDEGNSDFIRNVANDTQVQANVTGMNTAFRTALETLGFTGDSAEAVIQIAAPDKMFIPWRAWSGEINIHVPGSGAVNAAIINAQEKSFADYAGKLRARIAMITDVLAQQNDLGNNDQKPNIGGVVGGRAA